MRSRKTVVALAIIIGMLLANGITAFAFVKENATKTSISESAVTASASSDSQPFTPDGTGTVVNNATDEDGKEFYTITTEDENVFYLIVDKQRKENNVYFLNAVTEDDLQALAEKKKEAEGKENSITQGATCICSDKCEAGAVNTTCPLCKNNMPACVGTNADSTDEEPTPEATEKKSNGSMIFVILAVLAVGGAGYYFKVYKPKKDLDDAEDLDEILGEADNEEYVEEETINEDDVYLEEQEEDGYFDDDDILDDAYPEAYGPDEETY